MAEDIPALLRMHDYFRDLSEEILLEVVKHAKVTHYQTSEYVQRANEPMTTVGFVVRGRLKAIHTDLKGNEQLFRFIKRGEQFGMVGAAMAEPWPFGIIALEPSTVVHIDYEDTLDLTIKHRELRRRWSQTFARKLRTAMLSDLPAKSTAITAVFHESPPCRDLADRLIDRLCQLGENPCVFTDQPDRKPVEDARVVSLYEGDRPLSESEVRSARRHVARFRTIPV